MLSFLYVYSDHSILECYNLFSGVELSMRSFFVIKSSCGFNVNPLFVQGSSPHLIWVNSQAPNVCADERVVM